MRFFAVRTLRMICACAEEYRLLQENDPTPKSAAMWVYASHNFVSLKSWNRHDRTSLKFRLLGMISCVFTGSVSDFIRPHRGQNSAGLLSRPSGPCGVLNADFLSKWVILSGTHYGLDALWGRGSACRTAEGKWKSSSTKDDPVITYLSPPKISSYCPEHVSLLPFCCLKWEFF